MTIPLSALPEITGKDPRPPHQGWFGRLLRRLHFHAGIFIGPFIIIAARSGALYAVSPQLEEVVYADELSAPTADSYLPLADQVSAADTFVGSGTTPSAVRPAPELGATTRVMYADPSLHLGDFGRYYSELVASWLDIAAADEQASRTAPHVLMARLGERLGCDRHAVPVRNRNHVVSAGREERDQASCGP